MILDRVPRTSKVHSNRHHKKHIRLHNLNTIKIVTIKTKVRPWSQCNLDKIPFLSILHQLKLLRILHMLPWWDQEEIWSNSSHLLCSVNHRLSRLLHNLSSQCNISRIFHLLWDSKLHKWTISFRTNKCQVNKFLSRFSSHKPWEK